MIPNIAASKSGTTLNKQGKQFLQFLVGLSVVAELVFIHQNLNYSYWSIPVVVLKSIIILTFIFFFGKGFTWAKWGLSITLLLFSVALFLEGFERYFSLQLIIIGCFYLYFGLAIHFSKSLKANTSNNSAKPIRIDLLNYCLLLLVLLTEHFYGNKIINYAFSDENNHLIFATPDYYNPLITLLLIQSIIFTLLYFKEKSPHWGFSLSYFILSFISFIMFFNSFNGAFPSHYYQFSNKAPEVMVFEIISIILPLAMAQIFYVLSIIYRNRLKQA